MSRNSSRKPITAVSLKMYFERERTLEYVNALTSLVRAEQSLTDEVTLAVLPDFLTMAAVAEPIAAAGMMLGAQNLAPEDRGAFTGEVSGADLYALGARVVEIGHAERRTIFAESDAMVAQKVATATKVGLTPLLCIGEPKQTNPDDAAKLCVEQIRSALHDATPNEIWLAYEPYWAIGAAKPAEPEYVSAVCDAMRDQLQDMPGISILYGGSAGTGLIQELSESIDGLFLGRFAHDPEAFVAVAKETHERHRK
ncbi:triose-phosphate isomerase family protein [uncultured Tessaracoccus sp.]|uniref:triose-phosphate isomerase family protein n=1 Tax=uncultured Tessaracoccus sp. TaxID=905023 RepID=UPI002613982C|nr:triose-phosphate isomerase family protein [uncultured Tessaracoccus sp.]